MGTPKVGATIERYTLEAVLGEGGMGTVFRAHDARLDRRLAIKVLRGSDDDAGRADATARLVREARAAAAFDHPNAVSIFDVGEAFGAPYIAMELVSGRTVREAMREGEAPIGERLRWLSDVAKALSAAHKAGLVHRDVKPENVMVRDDGVVKVLDFGIARRAASAVDPSAPTQASAIHTLTAQGVAVGTPLYMAPEQIRGDAVDGRTDQFQWAVLAYEVISGRVPWATKGDSLGLVASILTDDPAPLREVAPEVSPEVAIVVARALAKRPADRFASMDDVVRALDAAAMGASVPAPAARPRAAAPLAGSPSAAPPRVAVASPHATAFQSRRFSQEELGAILDRALRKQAEAPADPGFGRDDVFEAAREVGIDRPTLDAAIRDLDATRAGRAAPSALERSRRQVKRDLATFAVVNLFLALMSLNMHSTWFVWVLLGWGMAMALKAVRVFVLHEPLDPKRKKKDAQAFDRNVDDGVSLLLQTTHARGSRVRVAVTDEAAADYEALAEAELAELRAPRAAR